VPAKPWDLVTNKIWRDEHGKYCLSNRCFYFFVYHGIRVDFKDSLFASYTTHVHDQCHLCGNYFGLSGSFSVQSSILEQILGAIALMMASFNLVGGFTITGRMLRMFKNKNAGGAKQ